MAAGPATTLSVPLTKLLFLAACLHATSGCGHEATSSCCNTSPTSTLTFLNLSRETSWWVSMDELTPTRYPPGGTSAAPHASQYVVTTENAVSCKSGCGARGAKQTGAMACATGDGNDRALKGAPGARAPHRVDFGDKTYYQLLALRDKICAWQRPTRPAAGPSDDVPDEVPNGLDKIGADYSAGDLTRSATPTSGGR